LFAFATAVFFLIATPGPGVLSIAGIGSGFGFTAGFRFLWGLCLGNFLVGLAVVSGLAALVFSVPYLREILLGLSLSYLMYLALKIALAGNEVAFIKSDRVPGFFDALALQAINPKAYAVNATLFSGFAFMPDHLFQETVLKFIIFNLIWIPIHFAWLYAGSSLKKLNLPPKAQFAINISMAISMLIIVFLAILSENNANTL